MMLELDINMTKYIFFILIVAVFAVISCPVPENRVPDVPVSGIIIVRNQQLLPEGNSFEILEGRSVILGARLLPEGITGGIHWQSSGRGIAELSSLTGPELIVTGTNGGRTVISVMSRNVRNQVYAEAECTITVIPSSFFKWNYRQDGWINANAYENIIIGSINPIIARTGETPIIADTVKGGFIMEGPALLSIGSVMGTPTNSPFQDEPLYDIGGAINFYNGPVFNHIEHWGAVPKPYYYPLWNKRARITIEYETEDPASSPLRIQVNNNTLERDNASTVSNWLIAELQSDASPSGSLSGIFNANVSALTLRAGGSITIEEILSNSFVCLALPEGKIIIRSIVIESAD